MTQTSKVKPRDPLECSVWAPHATEVAAVVNGTRLPMERRAGDWWFLPEPLRPGDRYAFSLDGGPPLPDPRSLHQPDGVHGPSAAVDPALFADRPVWDGREVRGGVGYELHIGTFTAAGTFDAAIDRLDHLVDLGVDYVELMPVAAFPGRWGWGYDGVALWAAHEPYGGPAGFVRFIDAAHARGLGVVLDVVLNHLGPEGNYLEQFGPYFAAGSQTPWGDGMNLDAPGSREVRDFLHGVARYWLVDLRVDGLRLDAVHALSDSSSPHFLAELAGNVADWSLSSSRPFRLIAESDLNEPSTVTPVGDSSGARGMDAQWSDDVHHSLHSFLTGEHDGYYVDFGSAETLVKALTRAFVHDGEYSTFRERVWGARVDPESLHYDGHSFVTSLQTHDQIGNRAVGDRIGFGIDPGLQAAGAALNLLSPFAPMLFMGEEWAASTPFPFFSDLGPELGPKVTEGRAREFARMGWHEPTPDPQAESTFRSAVLEWSETATGAHGRMLAWYRRLLQIRRAWPEVHNPSLSATQVTVVDEDTVLLRRGRIGVLATRAGVETQLGEVEILAAWDPMDPPTAGRITLPGAGVVVFESRLA